MVLDPHPGHGRLRTGLGRVRLRKLAHTDREAVAVMISQAAGHGISSASLVSRIGRPVEIIEELVSLLIADGMVSQVGELFVTKLRLDEVSERLTEMVEGYHHEYPLGQGLPREEARERLTKYAGAELFQYVVAKLVDENVLAAGPFLSMLDHEIVLSEQETFIKEKLEELYLAGGLTPPELKQIIIDEAFDKTSVDHMVTLLIRDGALERVSSLLFHRTVLERLRSDVLSFKAIQNESVPLEMAKFKERFGVSRKYAIPLLEYLDYVHVTRRVGSGRIIV
tara:strand:- start:494 stop:1336 length:843 start_codon:yes stop_codon:yes gene_type:complete